jgi:GntR family transcriptional regulator
MSIIRSSPVALYRQVADDLIRTYVNGLGGGSRLPTEAELAVQYDVSRITIRQALAHLAERGLIVRKQGKGTFVSEPRIHQDLQRLAGFHDSLVEHNIIPVTRLLEFGPRQAPPRAQQLLRLPDPPACFLKRQYLVDGRPLAVGEVYLAPRFLDIISHETAEHYPSYALLTQFGGVTIDRAEVTIRAQQAEGNLAGLLGVPIRAATMVLERLTYASTGEPCEHTTLYLRADAYEFGLTIDGGISLAANIRAIRDGSEQSPGA